MVVLGTVVVGVVVLDSLVVVVDGEVEVAEVADDDASEAEVVIVAGVVWAVILDENLGMGSET